MSAHGRRSDPGRGPPATGGSLRRARNAAFLLPSDESRGQGLATGSRRPDKWRIAGWSAGPLSSDKFRVRGSAAGSLPSDKSRARASPAGSLPPDKLWVRGLMEGCGVAIVV
jgi:hypothetical protein